MNWGAISAIAELIGSGAMLITLIYLALQVRQGNLAKDRETYRAFATEIDRVLFAPMTDPETVVLL